MAKMIALPEMIRIALGDSWELTASNAGLFSDGLRVDVSLYNGVLQHNDILSLSAAKDRECFAEKVSEISQVERTEVVSALLELKAQTDAILRTLDTEDDRWEEEEPGNSILVDPEPWDNPVDGADLIASLQGTIERFVALPAGASYAVALWILHTYMLDALWTSPILLITSPQPRCGKTTFLSVIQALARRAFTAASITPAALYRAIPKWQPTILIDEADTFLRQNDELRGVINSGHTRDTAYVLRCDGDSHEPELFSTWAAKAIASIGQQKDTIVDRSIEVPMRRRLPGEKVDRWRGDRLDQFDDIKRQCRRWAIDNAEAIRDSDPEVPDWLNDRAADNWRPLLQIADVAGDPCPKVARQALGKLAGEDLDDDETAGIMLLRDLQACFKESSHGRVFSDALVSFLHDIEERPWAEWGKAQRPITKLQVSKLLKPFGIKPKQIKVSEHSAKGYKIEDCQDAFSRYIPPSRNETPKPSSNGAGFLDSQPETRTAEVSGEKSLIPSTSAEGFGVSGGSRDSGEKTSSEREVEEF